MKLKKCNKREKIEGGTLNLVRKFSHLGFIGTKKISRWHRTLGLTMISFKLNWPSTCQMAVLVTPPVKNWTSYPKTRVQIPSKNKKITSQIRMTKISPVLLVMGGDSCFEGWVFESLQHLLDGHFSHLIVVKIVKLVWKTKINGKEAGDGPFFKDNKKISRGHKIVFICYLHLIIRPY